MATNKCRVYFALSGYNFDPEDVTRHLGIEPTSTDKSGRRGGMEKPAISKWEFSTETREGEIDTYNMMETIKHNLEPIEGKIKEISKSLNLSPRLTIELTLSIDKGESIPEVGFGGRITRLMADLGAFMNVDYKLSERV